MLSNYLRNFRSVNITALLASGEFLIDDNGYLVATGNGTRYRLPSGPPEGRSRGLNELQPIIPDKHQQLADSAFDWMDMAAKFTTSPTKASSSMTTPSSLLPGSVEVHTHPGTLSVSFALMACSLALFVNLGLISMSCWHLFRGRNKHGRRRNPKDIEPMNSIQLQTISEIHAEENRIEEGRQNDAHDIVAATVSSEDSHSSSMSLTSTDSPQFDFQTKVSKSKNRPHLRPYLSNQRSCLGIGVHVGLLGFLLAFLHLLVTCVHLSQSPPSTIICLFITSITTDTIYCVLLHLISCLLCLILIGYVSRSTVNPSRQQKFACLAMSHSLPWALAAGSTLFITLKPSSTSVTTQVNIFFTGFHAFCDMEQLHDVHLLTVILLVVIPLIGECVFILLYICCCSKFSRKICFLSFFLPIINVTTLTPVLTMNIPNLVLLPLTLDPIFIALIYRFSLYEEVDPPAEVTSPYTNQNRSPLHQTVGEISPSMTSEVYYPQTILAITPHRCNHGNGPSPVSPKLCPHYQHFLAHSQNCTMERRTCNEILRHADMLSNLSVPSPTTSPATAAVMAATAAAAAATNKHPWTSIATTGGPALLLGPLEGASLDRHLQVPILLTANGKPVSDSGRAGL